MSHSSWETISWENINKREIAHLDLFTFPLVLHLSELSDPLFIVDNITLLNYLEENLDCNV